MLDGFMAANDKFAQQVNPPTRPSLCSKTLLGRSSRANVLGPGDRSIVSPYRLWLL
jgi:hypothetical protein